MVTDLARPLGLQVVDLPSHKLPAFEFPEDALPQPGRHAGAVPLAEPLQSLGKLVVDDDAQADSG
jgi:hypothetical protein